MDPEFGRSLEGVPDFFVCPISQVCLSSSCPSILLTDFDG